jgi:hypothetical protein
LEAKKTALHQQKLIVKSEGFKYFPEDIRQKMEQSLKNEEKEIELLQSDI